MENLYNKYRSKTFTEFSGNDKLVKGTIKSLKENKYSNLQMFVGSSGSGKSTFTSILVKALSCKNSTIENNFTPCNECKYCKDIDDKKFTLVKKLNGKEIGTEEVSKLSEYSRITNIIHPKGLNIIWIDEAQALKSQDAFDKLLDITENSPKQTYWFLTSMNPELIPFALKSRFTVNNLENPSFDNIVKLLTYICEKENVDLNTDTLEKSKVLIYIADNANNSYRNAISLLETCITNNVWNVDELSNLNNDIDEHSLNEIVSSIVLGSPKVFSFKFNKDSYKRIQWTFTSMLKVNLGYEFPKDEYWKVKKLSGLPKCDTNKLIEILELLFEMEKGYYFSNERLDVILSKIILLSNTKQKLMETSKKELPKQREEREED